MVSPVSCPGGGYFLTGSRPRGRVLWQWNSADHVSYAQSEQPLPASASTPWDWFHINAVHFDTNGNLLIDARNTWTTYEVDPHTGRGGRLLCNAEFPSGVNTYRAFEFPWPETNA